MSSTMKAVVWTAPNEVQLREVPTPVAPRDWVVVKVAHDGICGTDLAIYHGLHPRAKAPLIPGHEITGWLASPGPDQGKLVAVEPLIECGQCGPCRSGNGYVCDHLGLYGIDAAGGMAEYVTVPRDTLHFAPAGTDANRIAVAEPLAVAVHAVRRSGLRPGQSVAVFGAGPIGMLTALVARDAGASSVLLTEPNPWRREHASAFGFQVSANNDDFLHAVSEATGGEGADVVFDAAAHPSVSPILTQAVRVLGTITIVGVYKRPSPIDLQSISFKELTMLGVRVYTSADFDHALDLIGRDALDLAKFTTTSFPLSHAADAYAAATAGNGQFKVLLDPTLAD